MIEPEDLSYLKEIFVPREECNQTVVAENEKINKIAITEAKNGTKLSIMIGILSAIAVPVIGLCVSLLFK